MIFIVEERTLEVENRIRELVKTVNDLITQRSNERLKYTKQINGTNMKINDFSYTDVIIDYLAKALDYHKDHFNELSNMNEQSTDEINGNMRNLHNKSFNDVMLSGKNMFFIVLLAVTMISFKSTVLAV